MYSPYLTLLLSGYGSEFTQKDFHLLCHITSLVMYELRDWNIKTRENSPLKTLADPTHSLINDPSSC